MGRIGITFEDVEGAVAELQGKQKNVTIDNVREILGTGSKSTIARFLREWRSQRGLNSHDNSQLPSDLLGMVNGLWDALRGKADAQTEEYRLEAIAKIAEIQQHLTQIRQSEASLRLNVHTLEEKLHHQTEEMQQLKAHLVTESQEKIRMTERAAAFDARCQEKHAENKQLHQLLKHVQENLEHYQAATQKLREEQSLLAEKQQNEYEQKLSLLLAQANTAINERSVSQAQLDHLTKSHEHLMAEHKTLTTQHLEMRNQYASLKHLHGKIQNEYDVQTRKNQKLVTEFDVLQRTVMELQFTIKSRDAQITSQEHAIAAANDKIETLRHESQFALQEKSRLAGQLGQLQAIMLSKKVLIEA